MKLKDYVKELRSNYGWILNIWYLKFDNYIKLI